MNDSMSILLATTILALGGLGLYMYKSSDENQKEGNEEYNESSIFGENFWSFSNDKNVDDDENLEQDLGEDLEEEEYDYKPRKKNTKTQRNKKSTGSSRRRYQ